MKNSEDKNKYLNNQYVNNNKSNEGAIARQVEYNNFIRDYFRDPKSEGKKLQDAIDAWNKIKRELGDKL